MSNNRPEIRWIEDRRQIPDKAKKFDMFHMFRLQGDWIATEIKVPL